MLFHPLAPLQMHAPDGFFSATMSVIGWALTVAMIALALRNTRGQLGEKQVPLLGIVAAAIFAGQMLNFTIPGGTSGHLLGGALAAIILGPWAAVLVMTVVVGIQALVFQDGGLLVMGLNILNMGIITAFVGYFAHKWLKGLIPGRAGMLVAGFAAAWMSLIVTAAAAAVELALSGTSPLQFALPAMVGVHAIIGIGEGLLTVFALAFIMGARPDLISGETAPGQRSATWVLVGVLIALAITLLSPLASPYSDGMERIAEAFSSPEEVEIAPSFFTVPEEQAFTGEFRDNPYQLLPDYTIPFLGETAVSTIIAGMVGVLIVFGAAYGIATLTRNRKPGEQSAA